MPWCFKRVFIILIVVIIIIIIIIIILCYYRAFKKLWSKKSKTLHETKKCCELIRSVIRRKIWEGRYEFGIEEQRTSGEREYVVGRQLWAFTPQVFRRRQISELFLSHVRIIHISIQVLIQTWTKKIPGTKKLDSCLAGYKKDFSDKKSSERACTALKRFHENIDSTVITPAKCFSLNYLPFSNQSMKTERVSILASLVWQLGTVSEFQHHEDLWSFSEKNQAEVKYWIRGTTGETRFHSILFARFYPGGDPGQYPAGTLVEIYWPASRERSQQVSRANLGENLRKSRRTLQRARGYWHQGTRLFFLAYG